MKPLAMTTEQIRKRIFELINNIEDVTLLQYLYAVLLKELSLNEADDNFEYPPHEVAEPNITYGEREKFLVELPDYLRKAVEEGLEDVRMGRVFTEEEAEVEVDELFRKFDSSNEKG